MIECTRCDGTGFLNTHQMPDDEVKGGVDAILDWIGKNSDHDVQVCDCCGDGETFYGVHGEHYNFEDPRGSGGPYEYNGGLCECH